MHPSRLAYRRRLGRDPRPRRRLGSADDSGGIVQGPVGAQGPAGPAGPAGPQGPKGDRGPAGRDATITCKVSGSVRDARISCSVKYKGHARLTRLGRTYVSGDSAKRLRASRALKRGHYTLRVGTLHVAVVVK